MTIVVGLVASLLGFLYFNWNPSKMFMGDTGSQYLGVLLAALSINYLWNPISAVEFSVSRQLLIPLLSFIIPIVDTTTVFINRLAKGSSPFIGGKDHTTHHLFYLGLSDKKVALLFIIISCISLLLVYLIIRHINPWDYTYLAMFSAYILLVFGLLFYTTKISSPKERASKDVQE